MKKIIQLGLFIAVVSISSCTSPENEKPADPVITAGLINPDYSIAAPEYAEIAAKSLDHMSKMEYDTWGTLLADDVEYNFPDGDQDTRTKLKGKAAVIDWWKNWQKKSGIKAMTMSLGNYIPVNAIKAPNVTGLPGIYVFSFVSNKAEFKDTTISVRMNYTMHFNDKKLIDRYYCYYDRTPFIKAIGKDMLAKPSVK